MIQKVNNNNEYRCIICDKEYASKSSLCNHNKKFHNELKLNIITPTKPPDNPIVIQTNKKYLCTYCSYEFNHVQNRWRHEQKCKNKINPKNEIESLKNTINEMKEQYELILKEKGKIYNKIKLEKDVTLKIKEENINLKDKLQNINLNKLKEDINDIKNNPPINSQLINIISDKNKRIEELSNNSQTIQPIIEKHIKTFESLTLNNIVITSRSDDNFINATQLCQAGGKQFNDWYRLNTTKQLINELACETGIPVSQSKTGIPVLDLSKLVDINKGGTHIGTWIHPELAIQLAQWLSPKFAIQVSKWIINLFTNGKVEITTKLLTENKLKDQKIKLLEDTYLKKHKREDYPDKNVIYIITTVDHLKNRIYIVGKSKNLKNRLSTYNKTCDHQVIYHKKCVDEKTLNLVENMILNKLKQYQEKANRDRFILPLENDISLFTNIIENCINFLINK